MRILTVGNGYPPHHHGGYELVWHSAVEHLRGQGHEVEVLTTDTRTGTADAGDEGVHRELSWPLKDGRFEPQGLAARAAMARHNHRVLTGRLDAFEPDVVGWWSMGGLTLTMMETVRRREIPAVAFVHDEWLDYGRWADRWLASFTGPRRGKLAALGAAISGLPTRVDFGGAASYVFVSDFTRRQALGLGLGLESTSVAHSGIHTDFLEPAPVHDWAWRLLYVGRIDRRKGIDTAILALSHLPSEARLTIAGSWDPIEEERLEELAKDVGAEERVEFRGKLDRDDLLAAYAEADAVVFPVRWDEPWGLVPLEAMARGRPVVATGRGGSSEYLRDGENCLLFEAEDAAELATALQRLAAEPALRRHMREGGMKTAGKHTEPRFNHQVEEALVARMSVADPRQEPCRSR